MNAWFNTSEAWQLAGWTMLHFLWIARSWRLAVDFCARLVGTGPNVRYATSLRALTAFSAAPLFIAMWLNQRPVLRTAQGAHLATTAAISIESRSDTATPGTFSEAAGDDAAGAATQIDLVAAGPTADKTTQTQESIVAEGAVAEHGGPDAFIQSEWAGMIATIRQLADWLPAAWLVGAPLTFVWLAAGISGSRRLRAASASIEDGPVAEAFRRLQNALGVTRRVALAACDRVAQPVLVGIVRPVILLPAAAVTGWSPDELEMVLLHELAHVRRWDNLVNLLQRVIESLLFFHPAVWLLSRQVRRDREVCCDALVVRQTARPEAYASLLLRLAEAVGRSRASSARPRLAVAMGSAMADHPVAARVRRILKLEDETMRISRGTMGLTTLLMLTALVGVCYRSALRADAAPSSDTVVDQKQTSVVIYQSEDLDRIGGRQWARLWSLPEAREATVSWDDRAQCAVISGPQSFHDKIDGILKQRDARRAEVESTATEASLEPVEAAAAVDAGAVNVTDAATGLTTVADGQVTVGEGEPQTIQVTNGERGEPVELNGVVVVNGQTTETDGATWPAGQAVELSGEQITVTTAAEGEPQPGEPITRALRSRRQSPRA